MMDRYRIDTYKVKPRLAPAVSSMTGQGGEQLFRDYHIMEIASLRFGAEETKGTGVEKWSIRCEATTLL